MAAEAREEAALEMEQMEQLILVEVLEAEMPRVDQE
jgi:hypothetical protein